MIVVDASVAVLWFVEQPQSDMAHKFLQENNHFIAPALLEWELANVLLRFVRQKIISERTCLDKLQKILPKLITLTETSPGDGEMIESARIALRIGGSIYDTAYILKAKLLDVPLATADRQQAMLARNIGITVIFIAAQ